MDRNAMYGLGLGIVAIVLALIAIIVAMGSSGGGAQPADMSGVDASLAAQDADIDRLEGRIEGLQGELGARSDLSASVTDIQQRLDAIAGMEMSMDMSRIDRLDDELRDVSAALADLERRVDEAAMAMDTDSVDARLDELGDELTAFSRTITALQDNLAAVGSVDADDFAAVTAEIASIRMTLEELRSSTLDMEVEAAVARLDWLESATAPAYTKAYVEEAIRRYESAGRAETLDYYNTMDSVNGDLYLFVIDANSKMIVVHPTVPAIIGEDIRGEIGTDITGKNYGFEIATADESGKWVDYVYLNPAEDFAHGRKHTWAVKHDGLIFSSGWYEGGVGLEGASAASYTRSLVYQAVARYDANGRDATIDYYNTPESVDGQWYVFIADDDDVLLSHADSDLVGVHLNDVVSPADGYPSGAQVAAAATEDGAWTSYTYLNPATGNVETKHSWVIRHEGMIFGSGWYEEGPPKSEAAAYAQSLVQRAVSLYDDIGRDGAVEYYNMPESVDGEFYVFILRANDLRTLANGARPELVDSDPPARIDATGYAYGEAFAATTDDGHWVSYVFLNPATDELESKHTWIMEHDGLLFGSGWYAEPAAYTQHLVNDAISMYESAGREATVAYYNSEESVDGQFYVFIGDENDVMLAHPTVPANVGKRPDEIVSPDGYPAGAQVAAAATEEGTWTSYTYLNPETGNVETKHSWVIRHDGMIFGSGWYEEGPSKDNPEEYTQALVHRALNLYNDLGREGTIDYYNMPESADGAWYVFILEDREGALYSVANSNRPELVGTTRERIDANGFNYGEAFAAITEEGDGEWVEYLFTHPETREDAPKRSWVARRGNLLFGAGWYEGIEE